MSWQFQKYCYTHSDQADTLLDLTYVATSTRLNTASQHWSIKYERKIVIVCYVLPFEPHVTSYNHMCVFRICTSRGSTAPGVGPGPGAAL